MSGCRTTFILIQPFVSVVSFKNLKRYEYKIVLAEASVWTVYDILSSSLHCIEWVLLNRMLPIL